MFVVFIDVMIVGDDLFYGLCWKIIQSIYMFIDYRSWIKCFTW